MTIEARHLIEIKKPSCKVQTQYPLLKYKPILQKGAVKVQIKIESPKFSQGQAVGRVRFAKCRLVAGKKEMNKFFKI
jgi:hypothetical protein